jgi:TetR/AcrR family transcriptional regulator, transcriptional repressor for nem operon
MPRPRAFDEERATEAAMRAFWQAGYEATSTEDLCAATGLGRSSIYNTFTSKHDLFLKALRRYMTDRDAALVAMMEKPVPVWEKVRAMLWEAVEPAATDPSGCLVVNSIVELAPRDSRVAALLQHNHEVRFEALRVAIDAGRRAGEISTDQDPRDLAHFVIATVSGMRIAARAGADRETLEAIATTALRAF